VIDGALAAARAVHFAATLLLEGSIAFGVLVGRPSAAGEMVSRRNANWIEAAAFVVAIVSGAAWLLLVGADTAGSSVSAAISDGTAWLLLTQTQFGSAWQARAAGFLLLAMCMIAAHRKHAPSAWSVVALLLSIALAGSIAWSGHGAATPGVPGDVHVALDFLHLAAAGLWLGGLLPFTLILLHSSGPAHELSRRFSALATASVLILLPTGIANSWFALPSIAALTGTLYGQLLLAKIGLFLLMLAFAAVNRFVLVPQLASEASAKRSTARLVIHSGCEIALGVVILGIVGVLGILSPMLEHHNTMAAHADSGTLLAISAGQN
jgi:putative copper resistance protein D